MIGDAFHEISKVSLNQYGVQRYGDIQDKLSHLNNTAFKDVVTKH